MMAMKRAMNTDRPSFVITNNGSQLTNIFHNLLDICLPQNKVRAMRRVIICIHQDSKTA